MQQKSSVLIVDDEDMGRDALELLLVQEGYQLYFASSGQEAIDKANEYIPDIILLDIMMPLMDGYEVCSRLRATSLLAEVPIIMVTALDDRESRLYGIEVGADDFVTKPFDRTELRTRVRTILRLNRYRRLLAERSRFEWVVEQSNDGYVLINDEDYITYANSAARLYLNLLKELNENELDTSFLVQVNEFYRCESEYAWEAWPASNAGKEPRYLVRPETAAEPALWLQVETLHIPSDKNHEYLVLLRDISENMNLQRCMWSFQTLISHKLRAPLNGLVCLNLLQETPDLNTERAHSMLDIAAQSAQRLRDQVLEILHYVDNIKNFPNQERIQIQSLAEVSIRIKWDLELENITLNIQQELKNYFLPLSASSWELIFRELFSNAHKFHPNNAPNITLTVTTPPHSQNYVDIHILDDGIHISKEDIKQVWTPYYQGEKSFTGEVKGMGLGLSMIAQLIWGAGGKCSISNRVETSGVDILLQLPVYTEAIAI